MASKKKSAANNANTEKPEATDETGGAAAGFDMSPHSDEVVMTNRFWRKDGWMAKVIKNEDDDGWAVQVYQKGRDEPVLTSPWVMGRDKKNPKPFDANAFNTFMKTAKEVLQRHAQQEHSRLHKSVVVADETDQPITVKFDVIPDEYEPQAYLTALDKFDEELAKQRVLPNFKLTIQTAQRWVDANYRPIFGGAE